MKKSYVLILTALFVATSGCGDKGSDSETDKNCENGAKICRDGLAQVCENNDWKTAETCKNGCDGDICKAISCLNDGEKKCENDSTYICESGNWKQIEYCSDGCDGTACKAVTCSEDGEIKCESNSAYVCESGNWKQTEYCSNGCDGNQCKINESCDIENAEKCENGQAYYCEEGNWKLYRICANGCDAETCKKSDYEGKSCIDESKIGDGEIDDPRSITQPSFCDGQYAVNCDVYSLEKSEWRTDNCNDYFDEHTHLCALDPEGIAGCFVPCEEKDAGKKIDICLQYTKNIFYTSNSICTKFPDGKYYLISEDETKCGGACKDGQCLKLDDMEGKECNPDSDDICHGSIMLWCDGYEDDSDIPVDPDDPDIPIDPIDPDDPVIPITPIDPDDPDIPGDEDKLIIPEFPGNHDKKSPTKKRHFKRDLNNGYTWFAEDCAYQEGKDFICILDEDNYAICERKCSPEEEGATACYSDDLYTCVKSIDGSYFWDNKDYCAHGCKENKCIKRDEMENTACAPSDPDICHGPVKLNCNSSREWYAADCSNKEDLKYIISHIEDKDYTCVTNQDRASCEIACQEEGKIESFCNEADSILIQSQCTKDPISNNMYMKTINEDYCSMGCYDDVCHKADERVGQACNSYEDESYCANNIGVICDNDIWTETRFCDNDEVCVPNGFYPSCEPTCDPQTYPIKQSCYNSSVLEIEECYTGEDGKSYVSYKDTKCEHSCDDEKGCILLNEDEGKECLPSDRNKCDGNILMTCEGLFEDKKWTAKDCSKNAGYVCIEDEYVSCDLACDPATGSQSVCENNELMTTGCIQARNGNYHNAIKTVQCLNGCDTDHCITIHAKEGTACNTTTDKASCNDQIALECVDGTWKALDCSKVMDGTCSTDSDNQHAYCEMNSQIPLHKVPVAQPQTMLEYCDLENFVNYCYNDIYISCEYSSNGYSVNYQSLAGKTCILNQYHTYVEQSEYNKCTSPDEIKRQCAGNTNILDLYSCLKFSDGNHYWNFSGFKYCNNICEDGKDCEETTCDLKTESTPKCDGNLIKTCSLAKFYSDTQTYQYFYDIEDCTKSGKTCVSDETGAYCK